MIRCCNSCFRNYRQHNEDENAMLSTHLPRKSALQSALVIALCATVCLQPGSSQTAPTAILQIDVENWVQYVDDVPDPAKRAADPGVTTGNVGKNFAIFIIAGDIVAVNGQPAKGTLVFHARQLNLRSAPNPGEAIADTVRNNMNTQSIELVNADGSQIGTLFATGLSVGTATPGAPLAVTQGANAIVGGTGAFLGVRGQIGQAVTAQTVATRVASMTEDPSNRRKNGGGKVRFVAHLIPASTPQIVMTGGTPAVAHAKDFSLVTAANPASPGEILSLFATGLGPTRPGVDPGQPFPSSPLASLTSPTQVTVNGTPAEVIGAAGLPGAVDGYQVNFRLPPNATKGTASVQLTVAWISSQPVNIPVQ